MLYKKVGYSLLISFTLVSLYVTNFIIPFDYNSNIITSFIQSEATIIAIVISLSFIAIQLAVSSFSARVITTISKNRTFWLIIGLYLFTIIYSIIVFIRVNPIEGQGVITPLLKELVLISYSLGIIAIMALVPYILVIFDLLQPKSMINQLKNDINENKMCIAIKDEDKEDPIQPITDIIYSSIERNDSKTYNKSLNAIETQISKIMKKDLEFLKKEKILNFALVHLTRIDEFAMLKQNTDVKIEVAKSMHKLGNNVLGMNENLIVQIINNIGNLSLDKELESEKFTILKFITELADNTSKLKLDNATSSALSYIYKSILMIMNGEKMYYFEMGDLLHNLDCITFISIKYELQGSIGVIIRCVSIIGEMSTEKHWDQYLITRSITYLKEIGKLLIRLEWQSYAIFELIISLENIGKKISKNESDVIVILSSLQVIVNALHEIKKAGEDINSEDTQTVAIRAINNLQKIIKENESEYNDLLNRLNNN